jgi:hypothetical protein
MKMRGFPVFDLADPMSDRGRRMKERGRSMKESSHLMSDKAHPLKNLACSMSDLAYPARKMSVLPQIIFFLIFKRSSIRDSTQTIYERVT